MVDSFDTSGGEIVVTFGGVEKFSTLKKPFNRVPLGQITLTAYTITFPNFYNLNYRYNYYTNIPNPAGGSFPRGEVCFTEGRIGSEEWGPPSNGFSYVSPYSLPDILIGAVPAGTNYLDVQATITRTTTPKIGSQLVVGYGQIANGLALYDYNDWPIEFTQGVVMNLTDAALCVEKMGGMSRIFWFEIISGNVYLRRRMSIGGYLYTHLIDNKSTSPPTGALSSANVNGSGCAAINSGDFTSVFTGDFNIVPCAS